MIDVEVLEVAGFMPALHGMRNPLNSWNKQDSTPSEHEPGVVVVGQNDLGLMQRLTRAGTEHRKFLRMINVYMDITAPLYWWKEFDTYKVGTVANSCSTMHKLTSRDLTIEDFSHEHMTQQAVWLLEQTINQVNAYRKWYTEEIRTDAITAKEAWWHMIQLLPSSYNQKRTVMMNYETAFQIVRQRSSHKLDEWRMLCIQLRNLPYMEDLLSVVEGDK